MTVTGTAGSVDYVIAGADEVLSAAARFGGAEALLSDDELAKTARFRSPQDASGYAAAHILFRIMAARTLRVSPRNTRELTLHRSCRSCGGPHGKSVITGANLSLSRVRDSVMVASAWPGQPLGADLEAIPQELHPEFDDFALSPAERQLLAPADVESRLRLWVAKEAALKATGHGLAMTPGALHIEQFHPGPQGTTSAGRVAMVASPGLPEAPGLLEAQGLQICWVEAPAQHAAALAVAGQPLITRLEVQIVFGSENS